MKKDHAQEHGLYNVNLTAWYHYINHVMDKSSNISESPIVQYDLLSSYRGTNCVDRIISGVREGVFFYRWDNT